MAVSFLIPGPLRLYTAGASKIQLEASAATVGEALGALWEHYPGVRDRVVTEQGEVREYVNIFVGDENIRDSGGLATPVRDGCEIMIVPSVAGGTGESIRHGGSAMTSVNELYGTWRLVSCKSTIVETGESEETFGKAPSGFIHYGPDDRMMVLVVRDERPRPPAIAAMTAEMRAELLKTMVAYAGTFSFDGKTVIHHIDVSWNELWTGTNQLRNIQIEGRRLRISTNPEPHPGNGKMAVSVLVWEKVE